ncbi:MAG: DUF362 domain-containing protein [Bacilli bacterium]|nr:DUF362 domain-containing protein [Bacilli bacterium]
MSKVYFIKEINETNLVKIFEKLSFELKGKVAVKVHSGEKGNQNFLHPEFVRPLVEKVNGTIVECNTAYGGERNETKKHQELMDYHGWTKYFDVDIMDAEGEDLVLQIPNGKQIKQNYVGKNLQNYDSMLVISHFKGHPMGGYGGAIKQLSIGCASSAGKSYIHSAGKVTDQNILWSNIAKQNDFLEAMADSALSIVDYFKGNIAYVNIMCNMSVDCDCCSVAEDPCMKDIGILASLDPVAIDKACIDLVYNSEDPGKEHFLERVTSRNGTHTIDASTEIGLGSKEYELIEI